MWCLLPIMSYIPSSEQYDLYSYRISPTIGFLFESPLVQLSSPFLEYENFAANISKYNASGKLRSLVEKLPFFQVDKLESRKEQERAMLLLSIISHVYLHGNAWLKEKPIEKLPRILSEPWCQLSKLLDRPPVLSHASIVLNNWEYIDSSKPFSVENVMMINGVTGGMDEEWFFRVTAEVEANASSGIVAACKLLEAVDLQDKNAVVSNLENMGTAMDKMTESLKKMRKQCDPYIFYHRVRTYLSGWEKGSLKFPNGIIYEGVSQESRYELGASAAQSTPMHVYDEIFQITHKSSLLKEMRKYMPKEHREFISMIGKNSSKLQDFINDSNDVVKKAYNDTLHKMCEFRSYHIQLVASYIISQSKDLSKEKGTGSSSLIPFLKELRKETQDKKK